MSQKHKAFVQTKHDWPTTIIMSLGAVVVLFPLYMTIAIALKTPAEMGTVAEILRLPVNPRWANFTDAIRVARFGPALRNSTVITGFSVSLTILLNSMVGYAIGRNMNKLFFRVMFYYFVSAMFIPFAVIMLPIVRQMTMLNYDSIPGLITLYVVYGLPLSVFFYTAFMKSIPIEFEEAALMDGASILYTFWKLIFPLMKPMHATLIIITGLWTWNDFLLALIILNIRNINTLALAQFSFQAQFSTNYNLGFASYLMALAPMLILFIVAQKWVVNGLTRGGLKT